MAGNCTSWAIRSECLSHPDPSPGRAPIRDILRTGFSGAALSVLLQILDSTPACLLTCFRFFGSGIAYGLLTENADGRCRDGS
jgi:hypothetical protein